MTCASFILVEATITIYLVRWETSDTMNIRAAAVAVTGDPLGKEVRLNRIDPSERISVKHLPPVQMVLSKFVLGREKSSVDWHGLLLGDSLARHVARGCGHVR